ncbi:MAG: nickel pincer cofactor biosynthesis protein LarC [Abditibacteriaceae bacterium]
MKIAYFDCFAGIAGDMALGALLDCGVPLDELRDALRSLSVEGWELETEPVLKSGIHALKVRITLHGQSDVEEQHAKVHDHEHYHDHEHSHHHHHEHSHDHDHHGASMAEIRQLIEKGTFSERVKQTSLAIFEKIAVAEAHQHHTTPDKVHFHEIGGVDSLLDICGVAWCLEYLEIDKIYASRLPLSTGFVDCAHGRMPVPAPAVMELLKGAPVYSSGLEGEMITPTGAGILAALCDHFGDAPAMTITQIGCGGGTRLWPDRPNLLRVTLGNGFEESADKSTFTAGLEHQNLRVLETNIDDMNPQLYDDVCDKLWQVGALDVWLENLQMKKNRPGVKLGVLCESANVDGVLKVLLLETTSLGVRIQQVQRLSLKRRIDRVTTPFGEIAVKLALDTDGNVLRGQPEYNDLRKAANQHNLPLQNVENAAKAAIASQWPVEKSNIL